MGHGIVKIHHGGIDKGGCFSVGRDLRRTRTGMGVSKHVHDGLNAVHHVLPQDGASHVVVIVQTRWRSVRDEYMYIVAVGLGRT